MKKIIKTKTLELDVTLHCVGSVNNDSEEQLNYLNKVGLFNYDKKNIVLSKKEVDEVSQTFRYKISGDCLKSSIIGRDNIALPNASRFKNAYIKALAQPENILAGYLSTNKKYDVRKKSPITVTPAFSNKSHREVKIDINTCKTSKEETSTSMRYVEDVPEDDYKCRIIISLDDMQFICCDDRYGNENFKADTTSVDLYVDALKTNNMPDTSEDGIKKGWFYNKKNSMGEYLFEEGILLGEKNVSYLVKTFIEKLLVDFIIRRRVSVCTFKKMDLRYVNSDNFNKETIENFTIDDLDNYEFYPVGLYAETSQEVVQERIAKEKEEEKAKAEEEKKKKEEEKKKEEKKKKGKTISK